MTNQTKYALEKWKEVREGRKIVFSDETLDLLLKEFDQRPEDDKDADLFFHDFVTIPNQKRVGVRDQYIGYIKGY